MDISANVRAKLNTYRYRWNSIDIRRRVVAVAAMTGLAVVTVAVIGISTTYKTVMVEVDGRVKTITTWQRDTTSALQEAGVSVRPADVLLTSSDQADENKLSQTLRHRDKITVIRALPVGVLTSEKTERRWVAAPTVVQAAEKISATSGVDVAVAVPHPTTPVAEDETAVTRSVSSADTNPSAIQVVAETDTSATLEIDGKETPVQVLAGASVKQVLDQSGTKLSPLDRVTVSATDNQPVKIQVTRISRELKTEEQRTERPVEEIKDDSMYTDETEVVEEGSDEVIVRRHFVISEDDKVTYEQLLSEEKTSDLKTRVVKVGTKTRPHPASSGGHGAMSEDEIWAYIVQCESGGNPRAVNPAGYYGLYQFDLQTWQSVGGTGNPIDASPEEQTMRAKMLQAQRGWSPWGCAP